MLTIDGIEYMVTPDAYGDLTLIHYDETIHGLVTEHIEITNTAKNKISAWCGVSFGGAVMYGYVLYTFDNSGTVYFSYIRKINGRL